MTNLFVVVCYANLHIIVKYVYSTVNIYRSLFMFLFNTLRSFWASSCMDSSPYPDTGPLVNTDGTPMLDDCVDILGKPFGVTDTTAQNCGLWEDAGAGMGMFDCTNTTSWDSGASDFGGSADFGDGF
jgi:hypothetical protein